MMVTMFALAVTAIMLAEAMHVNNKINLEK